MIYRRDDGHLSCREHPGARFGTEPLGDNLTTTMALGHLERDHPDFVATVRRIGLEGVIGKGPSS